MKSLLDFFLQLNKLKEKPRRGWVLYRIKRPETTADHLFRSTILGWLVNEEKKLDEEKLLKTLLIHDIFEVYVSDFTPYDPWLLENVSPKNSWAKIKAILKKPPPFSLKERKKIEKARTKEEEVGLKKLIYHLPQEIKKEIFVLWLEQREKKSKIGQFAWEIGKLESFLQAFEYWKREDKVQGNLWIRWAKKTIKDKNLLELRNGIINLFLNKKPAPKVSEMLLFLREVGKLKNLQRRGWVFRGIKNAETVAQHTFQMTLMSWVLGRKKGLDIRRTIKIALAHDLCEVYAGDQTPYDPIITTQKALSEVFQKPPRISQAKRLEWLLQKRTKEWKAIVKLTSFLPKNLQEEIINLWVDFEEGISKEGRFVAQVDKIANLIQAIEYFRQNKNFPIIPWWIEIKERIDDPLLVKFLEEIDKYFSDNLHLVKENQ